MLEKTIPLRAADGTPYNGQVNPLAGTGEKIVGLDGTRCPRRPTATTPKAWSRRSDGTFWVSDEYGPFITHSACATAARSSACRRSTARCRPS